MPAPLARVVRTYFKLKSCPSATPTSPLVRDSLDGNRITPSSVPRTGPRGDWDVRLWDRGDKPGYARPARGRRGDLRSCGGYTSRTFSEGEDNDEGTWLVAPAHAGDIGGRGKPFHW